MLSSGSAESSQDVKVKRQGSHRQLPWRTDLSSSLTI